MIRTFLDSGVLLAAARSVGRERALQVLEDPERTFLTTPFVQLELIPKAVYFKKRLEVAFYNEYFHAAESTRDLNKIEAIARTEAARTGLAAMDALHLAAAKLMDADEFVTTERPGKPMYRTSLVRVVYLFE
jgi:predicted nucleic acid-binding protein